MADRRSIETPTLLRDTHELEAFDSGEAVLNEWLRKRALHDLQTAASRTYVACETGAPRVIAFYALSMGQILAQEVPGSMRRNMPKQIFAVVLGDWPSIADGKGEGSDASCSPMPFDGRSLPPPKFRPA